MDNKPIKAAMGHKIVGPHGRDNSDKKMPYPNRDLPVNNGMNTTSKSTSGYGTGAGRTGGGKMRGGY